MKTETVEIVYEQASSQRIDKFLAEKLTQLSRAKIQELIAAGEVSVNGKAVTKASHKLQGGELVSVNVTETAEFTPLGKAIDLNVVYEDEQVLVINKPAGMVVHPGAGNEQETLVNALLHYYPQIAGVGEPARPGIVHRLDKETSGVMIVAKTAGAYNWLVRQFKNRRAIKSYLALVDGKPPTPTGRIETRIGRDDKQRQRMAVTYGDQGRKAETEYYTVKEYRDHTLLEVLPLTGRTHQIRVHLAFLGCPVVGDRIYGRRKKSLELSRFFLHASKLKIRLPGNQQETEFSASLPADLQNILDGLEQA
ncbi:MAG: RluA family pseudouridine synthase [Chloroflexi bacterium]|nr:RluA family pseudouridine synthase [Chloroflexota bacterium]